MAIDQRCHYGAMVAGVGKVGELSWEVFEGHIFKTDGRRLSWRLGDEEETSIYDSLDFPCNIVSVFTVHGRLYVVLDDGCIARIEGFADPAPRVSRLDDDYNSVCIVRMDWVL